jgi:hypothetical protein
MNRPDAPANPPVTKLATRLITGLLLTALGLLAVLSATLFVEQDWRHSVDSAIYLLTAKSLSLGEGYTYLGRPFFVRPPALSWCLSLVMGQGWDFALYNQLIQLSVAASLGAMLLAMSRLHGWCAAALVTLLFGLNPLALNNHNTVLAEYPFLALFFTAAWLLSKSRDGRQPGTAAVLIGAVLLSASVAFRTIGVLFLPGLVLLSVLRLNGRRSADASDDADGKRLQGVWVAAIVVASLVPWTLYCRDASTQAERPSTQLLMFDYTTALFHTNPSDPDSPLVDAAGWGTRIGDNLTEISQTVAHAFLGGPPNEAVNTFGPEAMIVTALLGACLLFTVLSRRSALDLFAATSVVLLLLYFTFADRLLLPLIPLLISSVIYTAERLGRLAARLLPARLPQALPPALLIALFALALGGVSLAHMEDSRALTSTKLRFQRDDLATAAWVRDNLPEDARLLHEKGAVLSLLSGRTTYTYRNLPGPWPTGCPEVDYALFSPRPRREPTEALVAAVARTPILVPFKWKGKMSNIRIYALAGD